MAAVLAQPLAASSGFKLDGVAHDSKGRPVAGLVRLVHLDVDGKSEGRVAQSRTSSGGRYEFPEVAPGRIRLTLIVRGMTVVTRQLDIASDIHADLESKAGAMDQEITVTATGVETRLDATPASVVIVTRRDLERSGGLTVDDTLRQIPGFSLFRRTGSLAANPTTQGASLRGIGASGASRTAVFDDGVPLNDAFGGWVYWGRVPVSAIDRVEVRRGGGSDLYGSAAMGGAISFLRPPDRESASRADLSYGELQTARASFFTSIRARGLFATVTGESFGSDGYFLLEREDRGAADRPAGSTHHAVELTVGTLSEQGNRYFARAGIYDESRANGTRMQHNRTDLRHGSLGADLQSGATGVSARVFATDEDYEQTFSSLSVDRNVERRTRAQRVPSSSVGFSSRISTGLTRNLILVAGVDGRRLSGVSFESAPSPVGNTVQSAGGKQIVGGLFGELLFAPAPRVSLSVAVREDGWRSFDAFRQASSRQALAGHSEAFFSPRISLIVHTSDRVAVSGSWYRAFRAPTLNELYRSFRVGNVLTLGNERLEAERVEGAELGSIVSSPDGRGSIRANLFSMRVLDTIANVTLAQPPALITKQRENLGRSRTDGLELDASWHSPAWSLSAGYLFSDARVTSFSAMPALEGLRLPQVPRSQLSIQMAARRPGLGEFSVQSRWVGQQYDDDQNRLSLADYLSVDANYSLPVRSDVDLYVAVENLFNERYEVGRTPQLTIGPPRIMRIGARVHLPR